MNKENYINQTESELLHTYNRFPVVFEQGEGVHLYDTDGKEYLDFMHENGLAVWVNPIVYDYRAVISAHHTDDVAIAGDPDTGWGWLAERGFDILQTDWLMPADVYLTRKGYRHA